MDFLQASIDAALKSSDLQNGDYPDDEILENAEFDEDAYNAFNIDDNNSFNDGSPENHDSINGDDQPPILEEPGFNDSALSTLSQVLTSVCIYFE